MPHANEPPLLSEVVPSLVEELKDLLLEQDEPELAAQVPGLPVVEPLPLRR
jgi:hypothetical protein